MGLFDTIARPFGMLLMFFYNTFGNYGLAIIVLAIIIKLILLPFQMKSKRGMLRQSRLQPMLAEIQKKHGANKQKAQEETMKLYKEEGINPASGCIWGLLPMPILFAIFQVIRQPITIMMGVAQDAYHALSGAIVEIAGEAMSPEALGFHAQIQQSQWINDFGIDNFLLAAQETQAVTSVGLEYFAEQLSNLQYVYYGFLGLNLSVQPQWDFLWNAQLTDELTGMLLHTSWIAGFGLFIIPFLAAAAQFASMRINRKFTPQMAGQEGQAKGMMMVMNFMPLMSVYIGFITPAALGFYWLLSSLLQTVQDVWLNKVYMKKIEAEEAVKNVEREKRAAELEVKRQETERLKAEGKIVENKNTSKRKKQRGSKQEQQEKAAEWEKKKRPSKRKPSQNEPGRIGDRRFARGRAYDPDRYKNGANTAIGTDTSSDDNEDEESKAVVISENTDIQNEKSHDDSDNLINNDIDGEDFEEDDDYEDDGDFEDGDEYYKEDEEYEEYEEDDEGSEVSESDDNER